MTAGNGEFRSLDFERLFDHPPEKVWRALTQKELLSEWMMPSDFTPEVGRSFTMKAQWGEVTGRILVVEPERRLSYTWNGPGLSSEVTWTLTPRNGGTLLRLDHTRIPFDSKQAYHGAKAGWPGFLDALEKILSDID